MYLFENLNVLTQQYLSEDHRQLIWQAYIFARNAHNGQSRSSGEPYITHPIAVACILAKMRLDHETLMGALLHDVIEDTQLTYKDMEHRFGNHVAKLVEGVSKLDKFKFRDKKEAQAENLRKMIMAMVQDVRVVLIKLADRIHNMRTLDALPTEKRQRIARETLGIYSLLAHRLGMYPIKNELEELGFAALYPKRYHVIHEVVKTVRNHRKKIIQNILTEIQSKLTAAGIACRVSGQEKDLYSMYCNCKMHLHLKEPGFHSIMNFYVFRVIVNEVDTCYRVLGKIHSLYKTNTVRVKDYIAIPKKNGYQSLHTSMVGPHGVPVEILIRTEDMDQMAEMGVAAHWAYQEKNYKINAIGNAQRRAQHCWMQSLLDLQKSAGSSFEFIESVKSDFFTEDIYVFTPKGHIIELPSGSTPIDFGYAVHTNIGHTCIGARVDNVSYPLYQPLSSGQTVEIITNPSSFPSNAWLNFVMSSKARAKIRQWIKSLN